MLDLRFVRTSPDQVKRGAKRKGLDVGDLVDRVLAADAEHREVLRRVEDLRAAQKRSGKELAALKDEAARRERIERDREAKAEIRGLEERMKALAADLDGMLLRLPSPPAEEVPEGATEAENVEIRRWGEPPRFEFEPLDHVDLGERLGAIDIGRGARLAGSRNYVLRGPGARLEWAVFHFAMDRMLAKGFVPLSVPVLVRDETMVGTGYYPGGEDQAYRVAGDGLSLVGTAEVPVTSLHAGEILSEADLPRRYVAHSACFRREAGAAGRDTKGLYRVHQFQKIEQVVLCVAEEAVSVREQEGILGNAEEILQALELPYRVVDVCAGDLGLGQVRKFDVETWMPSRGAYGETHSASRFHDFQARRLGIRYRDAEGRTQFVHTLNNTVVASPRILIALLENHQRADGSVHVPEALRPYLGGADRIDPLGPATAAE